LDVAPLYDQVREILEEARQKAARSVNAEMVRAYWPIGQAIVEREQQGQERAGYGERVVEQLARRMADEGMKGFGRNNLWYMRQFYRAFPEILHAPRGESGIGLTWTHYRLLLKVEGAEARAFYEREAAGGRWTTRELERQIGSLSYERALLSRDKARALAENREQAQARAATASPAGPYAAAEFIKDPYVLEFLGLPDAAPPSESDLEAALLRHLQEFLLELGKGFSFVGSQQRLTLDGDHFYVDLVFYNRLLRCFVLIDLKVGKLTHGDIGQMQLYVNYYNREVREEWEEPTIGILLCADKNAAVVRYTLPEGQSQVFASRYRLQLPSEAELVQEIRREQEAQERRQALEGGNS
jgi:predicted nuclease of restriction endonuclease-like (RecB) superfamily